MKGKFSVYIIRCKEGKFYIGLSSNTEKRIDAHNKKLSIWTSRFIDWKEIYKKEFDNYLSQKLKNIDSETPLRD